jgi:hypothetical protein
LAEQAGPDAVIPRAAAAVTAFVGRCLRGPVGVPVAISSFAEYQKHFGGLWQPSTLSYAVEQFFDNGGRAALVVRVCNGGLAPTITLRGDGGALVLRGLAPGSREQLRASVDYDGIERGDLERFNLVLQRIGGSGTGLPSSGLIEQQEIFRRVSVRRDDARFVGDALLESRLVRLVGDPPALRPALPPPSAPGLAVGYVGAANDGDDGSPLTDYDIIGSAAAGRGLFALATTPFNFLCIPPLDRERDVGASTLLVAARFCRERQALLLVDPPREWQGAAGALEGLRDWPFRADSAVMFFPRLLAYDRLRGRDEPFAPSAAAAGMLARFDEIVPPWAPPPAGQPQLRPRFRPACELDDGERQRLLHAGINVLSALRRAAPDAGGPRTLAAGNPGATDWRYLGSRRLAQLVARSVEQGTRWSVLAGNGPATWRRVRAQVESFLEALDADGAFAGDGQQERFFVVCDERLNAVGDAGLRLLVAFAASRRGEFHGFTVTQLPGGSEVRWVSVNRLPLG